jgi:hypothetical protein
VCSPPTSTSRHTLTRAARGLSQGERPGGRDPYRIALGFEIRIRVDDRHGVDAGRVEGGGLLADGDDVAPAVAGGDGHLDGRAGNGIGGGVDAEVIGRAGDEVEPGLADGDEDAGAVGVQQDVEAHAPGEGLRAGAGAAAGAIAQRDGNDVAGPHGGVAHAQLNHALPGAHAEIAVVARLDPAWRGGGPADGAVVGCGGVGKLRRAPVADGVEDDAQRPAVVDAVRAGGVGDGPGAGFAGHGGIAGR